MDELTESQMKIVHELSGAIDESHRLGDPDDPEKDPFMVKMRDLMQTVDKEREDQLFKKIMSKVEEDREHGNV